jgi:hypothetical protein
MSVDILKILTFEQNSCVGRISALLVFINFFALLGLLLSCKNYENLIVSSCETLFIMLELKLLFDFLVKFILKMLLLFQVGAACHGLDYFPFTFASDETQEVITMKVKCI